MRNRIIFTILLIVTVAGITSFVCDSSKNEPVYVDVNKLVEGYKRTHVEREAFNKKATVLRANVDSLLVGWKEELKTYEKEHSSMTKKELELKQQLLQNKQLQIDNYQQAIQKQIQEEDQKVTQTILNDINDYVKEYGKKSGYRIIFGANGNGNIMYAEEGSDLSQSILDGLNREYNGK